MTRLARRVRAIAPMALPLLALALAGGPAAARQGRAVVVGEIRSAGDASPVAGAVVHLEGTDLTATADGSGRFRLSGVAAGSHAVSVAAAGYDPVRLDVTVRAGEAGEVDVGTVTLTPSDAPPLTLTGVVRDVETGEPVPSAPVRLNGVVSAVTDASGGFRIVTGGVLRGAANRIGVRRIGYEPAEREFTVGDEETLRIDLALDPAAVLLDDIAVDAEGVRLSTGRMSGFFRRRQMGLGRFFTRDDIQAMGAVRVSDVFRRVPGAIVITEDNMTEDFGPPNRFAMAPRTSIQFSRRGYARDAGSRPCSPLLFVNDVIVTSGDVDALGRVSEVAGVEVYASAAEVPAEYNRRGSSCGVIVMWTDGPVGQGRGVAAGLEVGAHLGVRLSSRQILVERLGIQLLVPLAGPLEFRPGFNLAFNGPDRASKAGWQLLANLAARPFRRFTPWYLGTGLAVTKSRSTIDNPLTLPETELSHVILSGVSLAVGAFRPFVEIQLFDLLGSDGQTMAFAGFSVRTQ